MSYDIYLEGGGAEDADSWNYTSNCSPMWRAAGVDLAEFHDKRAGDCIGPLRDAVVALIDDPERFRAMDPPNGWGSYDSLLPRLLALLDMLRRYPDATVKVWA